MSYTVTDFTTKKALKDHVTRLNAEAEGEGFQHFQPGPFGKGIETLNRGDRVFLEGPHFPRPHTWYAEVTRKADGRIVVR